MTWILSCGAEILIDTEDFNKIDKKGWYLSQGAYDNNNRRKTKYVLHDDYGRLHRHILGLNPNERKDLVVDHIDRNGLNNQKNNLRIVDTSINKKNQSTIKNNQLNFNGISLEYNKKADYFRFKVSYNEIKYKPRTKTFSFGSYDNPQEALKAAILFRIEKMKENGYLLDERSTTIENELINNVNINIEQILNIDLKKLIMSKVGSSESKWVLEKI